MGVRGECYTYQQKSLDQGVTMNGNGHTNLDQVRNLIETAMDGVVDFDGQVKVDDVVKLLEKELDAATIQDILRVAGKDHLTEVILMFV